jgi:SepF-like predicted cell division protein (DUF552 family)
VLDKNPKHILDIDLAQMKNKFSDKSPNIILCTNPFLKTEFLNKLIDSDTFPVIFLDFDLLYSGYIFSGMIKKNENVKIIRSSKINWEKDLKEVIKKISEEKVLVILDSLNGVYNMFDEIESTRFINAIIMLLSSVARYTKSIIVATAMAIKNDDGEWILSPGGRHLMDSKKLGMYYLGMSETSLNLNSIEKR